MMSLPRPSSLDRQNILRSLITHSNIVLEGLHIESDPRSDTSGDNNKKSNKGSDRNDEDLTISPINNSDIRNQNQNQNQHSNCNEEIALKKKNTDTYTSHLKDGAYVCDSTDSTNTSLWVVRLSNLTAGYLPGDLSSVVRRAVGTFSCNDRFLYSFFYQYVVIP